MKFNPRAGALKRIKGLAHEAAVGRMKHKAASMKPLSPPKDTSVDGDEESELMAALLKSNQG